MIANPPNTAYQMGVIERHVGLLKDGVRKIQSVQRNALFGDVVRSACLARNNTSLMGYGLTPSELFLAKGIGSSH